MPSSRFIVVTVRNEARPLPQRAGSTPRGYDLTGAYGVTARASETVHALERTYGLEQVSAWPIASLHVHCVVFRVPASATRSVLVARLERDPRVESAEPLSEFTAEGISDAGRQDAAPRPAVDNVPRRPAWMPYNDPYAPLQRALRSLHVIDAQRTSLGTGVRIAIIDTGVDWKHPDLRDRVIEHRNFVDGDERQFLRDRHGTEVAGVIAAVANNGIGIVGVAPDARLLAYKACWQSDDAGAPAHCNSFTLAQGLEAAILARADIVNLSLTGPPDPLLSRLVRQAERQGALFTGAVAPATSADDPTAGAGFPTGVPGVLAIDSAEDRSGGAVSPSNRAEAFPSRTGYLLAPGRDILTLMPGGHYDFASGSSLATAEVSGILALMIAERRRLPAAAAARILAASGRTSATGAGPALIDACRALAETRGQGRCPAGPDSIADAKARSPTPR